MLAAIGGLLPAVTVAQTYPAKPIRIVVGHLNYSSAGTGTTTHIAGELLSYMVRIQMTHVPYRGTGQQLSAALERRRTDFVGAAAAQSNMPGPSDSSQA